MSDTNPAAKPEPSEIAGRYQVVQKLGAGAMGTVFKAKDKVLGRVVAIKTIRLEGLAASNASLDELAVRFKQEATIAANLKHPNIVTIYDFGTAEGLSYISMEFIEGQGLDRLIRSGRLPVERAAAIGIQVADALAFAHRHGRVHRDIKPANIMLEPGDRVKVTDFGIAKVTDSAEHLTVTGSLLGTPSYMSPEQARGGKIDGRSDLFAVGCILYEMLAGQKAFRGESITALIFKIITEEPPPLSELDPHVPDEMVRIVSKALAKSPDARYQTGRELADDLIAFTRPGATPTLRAADSPTLPSDPGPPAVPTVVSPGTARVEPTIASRETAARPAPTSSTPLPGGGPPPLPPTVVAPTTSRPPVPAAPRQPLPPRPQAARDASARKGGSAAPLVGLAVVGLLVTAGGLGAYYILSKRTASPIPNSAAEGPAEPPASSLPAEAPAATGSTAGAAPPSSSESVRPAPAPPPPAGVSPPTLAPRRPREAPVASSGGPGAAAGAVVKGATSSAQSAPPRPASGDYGYLDELPPEGPDGRELGEALASKYRSGGSSGYPTGRFKRRERFPRDLTPAERPAAATLGHILVAEEKFRAGQGRYGTLAELAAAQHLLLDVPISADSFQRARYRFTLTLSGDGFRAEAVPIGPVGRPLVVDDNGFVLVDGD